LVVGAGGIGCELLKNLVLSGFRDIEIIDLDTIDLSNLNRQFLFQKKHIGLPKSQVAKESAARFNPDAKIVSHFGNIKDARFGPDFFRKFDIVMNALDNLDARRHVNRLCISTDRPLIESGTAGYLGQVQVIKKGVTECYECQAKPAPKTYAYCTIRSSPTKPIHCIIWAKEEFKTHFGDPEAVIKEDDEVQDDAVIKKEEANLEVLKKKDFAKYLFHHLFNFYIFKKVRIAQLTGKDFWEGREPPKPLIIEEILKMKNETAQAAKDVLPDQVTWSVKQNAEKFIASVSKLHGRFQKGFLDFDKDDNDALDFVTSASNLRSHIFGIPLQSRFSVKSQAGNIIPAIATTNAIIAGLIVMEGLKILQNQLQNCRMVYLKKVPAAGKLLYAAVPEPQNPDCYVCASKFLSLKINTATSTLDLLINKVLKEKIAMNEPSIMVDSDIMYECGEGLEEDEKEHNNRQLKKFLKDVRINHNSIIEIGDQSQDLNLKISIIHCEEFEEGQSFEVVGNADLAPKIPKGKMEETKPKTALAPIDDKDDVMIIDAPKVAPSNLKRKRAGDDDNATIKKAKQDTKPAQPPTTKNGNSNSNSMEVIDLD